MSGFVVFKRLSIDEALKTILQAEQWFRVNPTRKIARTDLFLIRRGHVAADVLIHSEWKPPHPSEVR